MDQAKKLGLEKVKYTFFDVHLDEAVTYLEVEKILDQCSNSSAYYFKPFSFQAKPVLESDKSGKTEKKELEKTSQTVTSNATASAQAKTGDLKVTLTGTFLVRQR